MAGSGSSQVSAIYVLKEFEIRLQRRTRILLRMPPTHKKLNISDAFEYRSKKATSIIKDFNPRCLEVWQGKPVPLLSFNIDIERYPSGKKFEVEMPVSTWSPTISVPDQGLLDLWIGLAGDQHIYGG